MNPPIYNLIIPEKKMENISYKNERLSIIGKCGEMSKYAKTKKNVFWKDFDKYVCGLSDECSLSNKYMSYTLFENISNKFHRLCSAYDDLKKIYEDDDKRDVLKEKSINFQRYLDNFYDLSKNPSIVYSKIDEKTSVKDTTETNIDSADTPLERDDFKKYDEEHKNFVIQDLEELIKNCTSLMRECINMKQHNDKALKWYYDLYHLRKNCMFYVFNYDSLTPDKHLECFGEYHLCRSYILDE